jgi:Ca2+-binding EF-hand superfamily protein
MFKRTLIAALFLVPALSFAAENSPTPTAAPKGERSSQFKKADADGNGTLSRAEVEKSMPRLADKFDEIDANKDGQISRDEMKAWKKAHKHAHKAGNKADRQARAAERFKHADTNGDGKISRAEAEQNAPRLAKKFDAIDADKDGQLTQEELRAYRESKRSHKDNG